MKIGFNVDGKLIEGELTLIDVEKKNANPKWKFKHANTLNNNDILLSKNLPMLVTQAQSEIDPIKKKEATTIATISCEIDEFSHLILESIAVRGKQNYSLLSAICQKLNRKNALTDRKYEIAPAKEDTNNEFTNYRKWYIKLDGKTDQYIPQSTIVYALYEVLLKDGFEFKLLQ